MRVPGIVYVNEKLEDLLFDELKAACDRGDHGGFLPAVKQIANVAALPGIVSVRIHISPCCCLFRSEGKGIHRILVIFIDCSTLWRCLMYTVDMDLQ